MRSVVPLVLTLVLAFLGVSPAAQAQETRPDVKTVEAVEALPADATSVRLTVESSALVAALVRRLPGLTSLELHTPGNKIDVKSLELLQGFPKLTSLTLTGDAFLYDPEFAALGRLTTVRTLSMSLP